MHLEFVTIHPFLDGNGRLGRLLLNLVVLEAGLPWVTVRSNERTPFFRAIERAQVNQDTEPGVTLVLDGSFQAGAITLQAMRQSLSGGTILDRIKWSLLPGGIVRQFWDQSLDGGQTFALAFDGRYRRVPSVVPDPEIPTGACTSPTQPVYRQFDFTLGAWKVKVLGRKLRSSIAADLGSCLIEERLKGEQGYEARIFSSARRPGSRCLSRGTSRADGGEERVYGLLDRLSAW